MSVALYFYKGLAPTPKEKAEAAAMGALLRSRLAYNDGDFVEQCDIVAGDYPPAYAQFAAHSATNATPDSGVQTADVPTADTGKRRGKGGKG